MYNIYTVVNITVAGGKNILHGVNGWKRCLPWNAPGEDGGNVVNRH